MRPYEETPRGPIRQENFTTHHETGQIAPAKLAQPCHSVLSEEEVFPTHANLRDIFIKNT
jgi:hypothetical protein